jgi:NAD(P)-dependent dehydrogenase (short-subunit alcohol dehydrogenase family)
MRVIVVGASSGLGRCIAIGLGKRGHRIGLLARRHDRLVSAASEAGAGAVTAVCDVTDSDSCGSAIAETVEHLGGLDALIYSSGIGILASLSDVTSDQWAKLFAVNVTGASLVTAAAAPHLAASAGSAVYLSSLSASFSAPWPMLGAYAVSKAALDKLVEAWRIEHPSIGFTRIAVGDSSGGEGDSRTEFNYSWDPTLMDTALNFWLEHGYMQGGLVDAEHLTGVIDTVIRCGKSSFIPSLTLAPRPSGLVAERRSSIAE